MSLLDWRTGYGNARYWVLKVSRDSSLLPQLLIEHFAPGDVLFRTTVSDGGAQPRNPFCGETDGPSYGTVSLQCADPGSVIKSIDFADWGTPSGVCGSYRRSSCSAANTTAYVTSLCSGKSACSITPYPALGDPCYDVVKRFVVQATCTGPHGGTGSAGSDVFALGARGRNGVRKTLIINKTLQPQNVTVTAQQGRAFAVDPLSVTRSSPQGIRSFSVNGNFVLEPFAVVVVVPN